MSAIALRKIRTVHLAWGLNQDSRGRVAGGQGGPRVVQGGLRAQSSSGRPQSSGGLPRAPPGWTAQPPSVRAGSAPSGQPGESFLASQGGHSAGLRAWLMEVGCADALSAITLSMELHTVEEFMAARPSAKQLQSIGIGAKQRRVLLGELQSISIGTKVFFFLSNWIYGA